MKVAVENPYLVEVLKLCFLRRGSLGTGSLLESAIDRTRVNELPS